MCVCVLIPHASDHHCGWSCSLMYSVTIELKHKAAGISCRQTSSESIVRKTWLTRGHVGQLTHTHRPALWCWCYLEELLGPHTSEENTLLPALCRVRCVKLFMHSVPRAATHWCGPAEPTFLVFYANGGSSVWLCHVNFDLRTML